MPGHASPEDIATAALQRFVSALRTRDLDAAVSLFAEDAVLFGSEADEVAEGADELRTFLAAVFSQLATFGWSWDAPIARLEGDVVWFVVPAITTVIQDDGGKKTFPYRLSGVLRQDARKEWVFAMFNGSEPAVR